MSPFIRNLPWMAIGKAVGMLLLGAGTGAAGLKGYQSLSDTSKTVLAPPVASQAVTCKCVCPRPKFEIQPFRVPQ